MFIDSHAHLNFREFEKEIPQTLKRAHEAGVGMIVNVGSNYSTSQGAIKIAKKYNANPQIDANAANPKKLTEANEAKKLMPKIYASVGIHPIHLVKDIEEKAVFDGREYSFKTRRENFDYEKFKKLAQSSKKVVAIGETGIDLFRIADRNHPIDKITKLQSEVFREHIKLAEKLDLPLIIHGRGTKEDPYGAYDLILEILKEKSCHSERPQGVEESLLKSDFFAELRSSRNDKQIRCVAHCFAGNLKQARAFIKLGFYIGFTGIVTFKNAKEIQEIAQEIPLEKILIETDCPFLAPAPYRGKRNEPAYVVEVARKIAELKNISLEEVEKVTTSNAKKLFGI